MKRFEERITINASAGAVYDYVSDFTKHGEWAGHGLQVTPDADGPMAVGSTYSTVAKQFGTQREHSTVTELSPGKAFAWESKGGLGLARHRFSLEDQSGSTLLTKSAEIVEPTFLAKMLGWRLAKDIPSALRADLEKIKTHLEGAPH